MHLPAANARVWEQGLAFGVAVDRAAVDQWLAERETLWSEIEARPWLALPIGEREFDAHDVEAVNAELAGHGEVTELGKLVLFLCSDGGP